MKPLTADQIEMLSQQNEDGMIARIAHSQISFGWFLAIYFGNMFNLKIAEFQKFLIQSLESDEKFLAVLGFRGSAKSTIIELFTLYRIVTKKSKFAMVIGATDGDARRNLANIRAFIEENPLLIQDFGIFIDTQKEKVNQKWSEGQLNICGGSILARSRGQKVRGLKFKDSRPDLIVIDDLEDTVSTEKVESRQKTRKWFFSEVIPGTAQGELAKELKIIMIGNLVHRDCLLANIEKNNTDLVKVHRFAIRNENGDPSWPALYPDEESIQRKKQEVMLAGKGMGNIIWAREYELIDVDEENQIINESDIQYYTKDWLQKKIQRSGVGVDLAISKKETADYTAMVPALLVLNDYGEQRVLILPRVINERLNFQETVQKARTLYLNMVKPCKFRVEAVSYQQSAIEMLQKNGIDTVGVKPTGDKRARLMAISSYIKTGMVLFPEKGCEELITQLLGFGIEAHDDMVDALVYVIDGLLNEKQHVFGVC